MEDDATLVMRKEVYESEMQWGRLVIPGKYVPHFRRLQEEHNCRGDFHVLVQQEAAGGEECQIGVKMTIQRPMLIELHPIYRSNKVVPGDTLMIHQNSSTGELTVRVEHGPTKAQPARGAINMAVDASSSAFAAAAAVQPEGFGRVPRAGSWRSQQSSRSSSYVDLDELDTPTLRRLEGGGAAAAGPPRSRRTLNGSPRASRRRGRAAGADSECEEEAYGNGDGHVEAYRTSSGRWATRLVRHGSAASQRGEEEGAPEAGSKLAAELDLPTKRSQQLAAIDSQAIGYSDDMEVEGAQQLHDMQRFDALVNVATDCLST